MKIERINIILKKYHLIFTFYFYPCDALNFFEYLRNIYIKYVVVNESIVALQNKVYFD